MEKSPNQIRSVEESPQEKTPPQVEKLAEGFSPLEKFEGFSPEGFSPQSDSCKGFSPGSNLCTCNVVYCFINGYCSFVLVTHFII